MSLLKGSSLSECDLFPNCLLYQLMKQSVFFVWTSGSLRLVKYDCILLILVVTISPLYSNDLSTTA